MTDIARCQQCGSDRGFRIEKGEAYCKTCGAEYKSQTVREFMAVRNWLPEQRCRER